MFTLRRLTRLGHRPTLLARAAAIASALVTLVVIPFEGAAESLPNSVTIGPIGMSVRYPAGWSVAQPTLNSWVLVDVPADQQETATPTVRVLIGYLERSDHANAVSELAEIANQSSAPSTFLAIGGWPALQRVQLVKSSPPSHGPLPPDSLTTEIRTAVAAGKLLVSLGADLPPDADQQLKNLVLAIGQSLVFGSVGDPAKVQQELDNLRSLPKRAASTPALQGATSADESLAGVSGAAPAGVSGAASADVSGAAPAPVSPLKQLAMIGTSGELEVAVSNNTKNIVVVKQDVWQTSNDGGQTFPFSGFLPGPGGDGDSSIAFGQSTNFYHARLFGGSCPANTSCVEVAVSMDGGKTFGALISPPGCPTTGATTCSIDQEHISADRVNAAAGGGDNVYVVHRTCNATGGAGCGSSTNPVNVVCSNNSDTANSWSPRFPLEMGSDFPRVAVGPDGMVYVVYVTGGPTIRIDKFNPCPASAPNTAPGAMTRAGNSGCTAAGVPLPCCTGGGTGSCGDFPNTVSAFTAFTGCGVAGGFGGLDRCNSGNILSSPTVTVDDTNPNHVYVAWANNTATNTNENILVADSTDGGAHWRAPVPIQTIVNGRRYHPWACATGGNAFVTWYDRRAATPTQNDRTDYYTASAGLDAGGTLVANNDEFKINTISDLQCDAAGWPGAPRSNFDSENCSTPLQLAGVCIDGMGNTTGRCDFSDCGTMSCNGASPTPCMGAMNSGGACQCAAGSVCCCGNPTPKYGDYDGNACVAGRLFAVFASATQTGVGGDPAPNVFFQALLVGAVPLIQVPGSVNVPNTCVGTTGFTTLNVCNTGKANLQVNSITSSNTRFAVTTPSSGFPVVISPNFCFPFQVSFKPTFTGIQTATLTIASNDPANPSVTVVATGKGTQQSIRITGSTDFGDVCAGTIAEKTVSVCNVGGCDLQVSSASINCSDFTIINNPFPANVSPDACVNLTVRFTPTSAGAKSCALIISSNDPNAAAVILALTANTPSPAIDVPPDLPFPPTVVQNIGACTTPESFPVSNTGTCNLTITNFAITADAAEYSLANLPSLPIILQPGHVAGEGNLNAVFAPQSPLARAKLGTVSVTYVSEPVTGATTTVSRALCGEGVNTGARILVTQGGTPVPLVQKLQIQRITGNRRKKRILQSIDVAKNLPLVTVTPTAPCVPFRYHREYGTVSNPIQLLPGSYQATAMILDATTGLMLKKTVGFDLQTCDFNANIVIDF